MHPLAVRRGKAYLLDCLGFVGVGAAMAPFGVVAHRRGLIGARPVITHLVSAALPVIATVWTARQESGATRATWGKRRLGLTVTTEDGDTLAFGTALLRNAVKILIPWQIGHTVAIGSAYGGWERKDPLTLAATAVTYPVLGLMIGAVVAGSGRAVHDRVVRGVVHGVPSSTNT